MCTKVQAYLLYCTPTEGLPALYTYRGSHFQCTASVSHFLCLCLQGMDTGAAWEDLHAAIWRMDHALGTPAPWGASGKPGGFPAGARDGMGASEPGVPGGYPGGGGAEVYLWKHGGHPQMHRSLRLCQLDLEIARLCDSLPHGAVEAGASWQMGAVAGDTMQEERGSGVRSGVEGDRASRCAAGPRLRLRAVEALAVLRQGAASVTARARAEGTGRGTTAGGTRKGRGVKEGAEEEAQGRAGVRRVTQSVEEAGEEILEVSEVHGAPRVCHVRPLSGLLLQMLRCEPMRCLLHAAQTSIPVPPGCLHVNKVQKQQES